MFTSKAFAGAAPIKLSDVEMILKITGGEAAVSAVKVIVEIYNKGLQGGHIQIGAKQ